MTARDDLRAADPALMHDAENTSEAGQGAIERIMTAVDRGQIQLGTALNRIRDIIDTDR